MQLPLRGDRARIGGGPRDEIVIEGLPPAAAVLVIHPDEVRLVTDDDDRALAPGAPFTVGTATLVLDRAVVEPGATLPRPTTWSYELEASLTPARAVVRDPVSGRAHVTETDLRAVLLWVLARRWLEDDGATDLVRGWSSDEAVSVAVWGRDGLSADPVRLRVLLSRLRRDLSRSGLDGTCLEKRGGQIRIRLAAARLSGGPSPGGVRAGSG